MSIAHIQDTTLGTATNPTVAAQTGAFGANPTIGNYIVVFAWGWTSAVHTNALAFSDTGGNSYTVPTGAFKDQATDLWCAVGYAKVATSGATFKVTATYNNGISGATINVCAAEFSGVAAASPLDGSAIGATGTSTSAAPGSLSFTSGDLVVAVSVDDNTSYTGSTPTGFTRVQNQSNGTSFEVGEGIYAVAPASPTNPTRTITSAKWCAAQLALLAVSAAAVCPAPPAWVPNRWVGPMALRALGRSPTPFDTTQFQPQVTDTNFGFPRNPNNRVGPMALRVLHRPGTYPLDSTIAAAPVISATPQLMLLGCGT